MAKKKVAKKIKLLKKIHLLNSKISDKNINYLIRGIKIENSSMNSLNKNYKQMPRAITKIDIEETIGMSPSIPNTNESSSVWPTYKGFQQNQVNHTNEKRLASLIRKNQEINERKQQIKIALESFDTNLSSNIDASILQRKHIFFKDEETVNEFDTAQKYISNKNENSSPIKSLKKKLFIEDEELRTKRDNDQMLFKPQFEGKKGEKLLNLSLKIGQDQRFVLNENFVDSGESDGEEGHEIDQKRAVNTSPKLQAVGDEISINEEMDIYERALQSATTKLFERGGSPKNFEDIVDYIPPINRQKYENSSLRNEYNGISRFSGEVRCCSAIIERFDPTRADHLERFEIKSTIPVEKTQSPPKEKKKKADKVMVRTSEIKVESDDKKYYTVYRDLKGAFGNTSTSSSFTILKPSNDVAVSDPAQKPVEKVTTKSFNRALDSHFCEEERFVSLPTQTDDESKLTGPKGDHNFFISPSAFEDPTSNLNASVSNFCQRLSPNANPEAWERKRAQLSHLFKTKRKRYVRHKSFSSRRVTAFGKRN